MYLIGAGDGDDAVERVPLGGGAQDHDRRGGSGNWSINRVMIYKVDQVIGQ